MSTGRQHKTGNYRWFQSRNLKNPMYYTLLFIAVVICLSIVAVVSDRRDARRLSKFAPA
jgi:uncharacterized membrane protein